MSTNERAKLPKWAQEEIRHLEMQRNAAIRTLNEFQDSETKSNIWVEDSPCTGEETGPTRKVHYLQSHSIYVSLGKRKEIHLLVRDGLLEIRALGSGLLFSPSAYNGISVEVRS